MESPSSVYMLFHFCRITHNACRLRLPRIWNPSCRLLDRKTVKSSKRHAAVAYLDKVVIGSDPPLENVPNFDYLGSRLQGDGSDDADVRHRLEIALSAFSSLSYLWADHRLSRTTKLRLYRVCVCASLTHTAARPGPSIEP